MISGINRLTSAPDQVLKNRDFALITGSANIDISLNPVYRVVQKIAGAKMRSIWALQHGFFIDKQDNMIFSDPFFHPELKLPVRSLYRANLLPEPEWLQGISALVIDIFDIGTRVYTFVNHLIQILKFLDKKGIDIIVLDRPNPLNGITVEGCISNSEYFSIVGEVPVPMRHALTCAEILSYAMTYYNIDLNLEMVLAADWDRNQFFSGVWTYPSPNMPSFNSALVYPGAVMLEGTNISEGRGTTRPFEFIGAPFIDNSRLARELYNLDLPGVDFIPQFFKPEFSKFAGKVCSGLLVHPSDKDRFRGFATYYEIVRLIKHTYPEKFMWQSPPYEFEYNRAPIDMISGSSLIRQSIDKNIPYKDLEDQISSELLEYQALIAPHLLY